jgi:hypothetical protein
MTYQNGQAKDHSHQLEGVVVLLLQEGHGLSELSIV